MASLIEDLARRLGTSPKEARQHLQKLLAGLRAYAEREGQASLPGLGTFRHQDGTWTFEPAEALARSVNRSFDDLEPVAVSASANPAASASKAANAPERSSESESASEETASKKAAASGAPPANTGEEASPEEPAPAQRKRGASIFDRQDEEDPEEQSSEPARGLFSPEAPAEKTPPPEETISQEATSQDPVSPEKSAPPQPPEEPSEEPSEAPSAATPSSPDTDDDPWALAASTSSAPSEELSEQESSKKPLPSWTYAALPAGYLVQPRPPLQTGDLRNARLESSPASPSASPTPAEAESEPEREASPLEERLADDRADEAPAEPPPERSAASRHKRRRASRSGSGGRWLAALLVLLVVGLGAWYVLGQQGMVTGPVAVLQQGDGASEETAAATADDALDEDPTAEGDAGASPASASATDDDETDDSETSETPSQDEETFANAARIDRAQGGWTVVVASETSRAEAEQVAQRFAQRFQAQDYPVDILETTVDGTQRYRVVVGQFSSADQVIQTLEQDGTGRFPDDAWGFEIGSG